MSGLLFLFVLVAVQNGEQWYSKKAWEAVIQVPAWSTLLVTAANSNQDGNEELSSTGCSWDTIRE